MNLRLSIPALVSLALLAASAPAQMVPAPPGRGNAPLLFARFLGGPGLRVTFYQGQPRGRAFDAPVVVGLRPGYLYRLQLSHLPNRPGVSLYPTLEVRGSLCLKPQLNAALYPAPVVISDAEIESVLAGNLVSKVVYLEDPERAMPALVPPDQPIESDLLPGRDLLAEARDRGRPMLIIRMGGRTLISDEELAQTTVPGTILYPGEKVMAHPSRPPCLLWDCRPFYDPQIGPKHSEEECLHDGGDQRNRAGFDADGRLVGVEPEDTVAEYTDSYGRRHVTHSNCVCLCVPRFAVLRCLTPFVRYDAVVAVNDARRVESQERLDVRTPPLLARKYVQPLGSAGRERPSVNEAITPVGTVVRLEVLEAIDVPLGPIVLLGTKAALLLTEVERARLVKQLELARQLSNRISIQGAEQIIGTAVEGRVEAGPQVIRAEAETRDLTVCCCETPCPPDKPLVLIKCADRHSAEVGDVVTFMLKYSNHGGRPITDVAVTDSLTTRLEYIPGSSKSDRPAVFTTQANEAGSVILRWEIAGRLLPGQSGIVHFQARIR
jgi:uncharacterized repeat protein (TIGR01451 family)